MATSEATVHTALYTWVQTSTQLSSTAVVWAHQNISRPAYPYAVMTILQTEPIGRPSVQWVHDSMSDAFTPTIYGTYHLTVRVECVTRSNTVSTHARHYAQLAQARMRLPSTIQAFDVAGIGIVDVGPLVDITEHFNGIFLPRVYFDAVFNVVYAYVDSTDNGYIAHVEGTGTVTNVGGTELGDIDFEADAP